jgi:cell division septation protein DedD
MGMNRDRDEEGDGYFCRFTFGQFFALLIMEVFTIFFVFYLGAKYGRELLGINAGDKVAQVEVESTQAEAERPKVLTTADEEGAKAAKELMAKTKSPELKDRIRQMLEGTKVKAAPEAPSEATAAPSEEPLAATSEEKAMVGADRAMQQNQPQAAEDSEKFQGANVDAGNALSNPKAPPADRRDADALDAQSAKDTSVIRVKSSEDARYSVQVGSYPTMDEATKIVEKWKKKGYPAYMMIADIPDRGRWYRVRMGGFSTRQDADVYLKEVQIREKIEALVVLNEQ